MVNAMGLRRFIAKRIVYSFILLIAVITLNYIIFMLMPGDPEQLFVNPLEKVGKEQREEHLKLLRELWGFNDPHHVRFARYLYNLFTWNFGMSILERRPVGALMAERVPYTLLLLGGSTIISIIVGVVLGVYVANKRGGLFDSGSVVTALFLNALPTFWTGMLFILFFSVKLKWFPLAGAFPREWAGRWPVPLQTSSSLPTQDVLRLTFAVNSDEAFKFVGGYLSHAFLPILVLTLFSFGGWLLLTRATMLETLTEDYVVTARAKGVPEKVLLFKHALKNASLPLITSIALSFGFVLSGAIITETVFTWPGLGTWVWSAINGRDYQVLMAFFYMIAICVIVANIIADVLYGVIDPRVRYGD